MAGPATWDQSADLEEGNYSDFDAISPAWDQEADVEELGNPPTDFDSGSPAWDKYNDCETVTTPFGFDVVTNPDGDFNSAAAAKHDGTYGIEVTFDDATAINGRLSFGSVNQTTSVYAGWWNFNDLTLEAGTVVDLIYWYDGAANVRQILRLYESGGIYYLQQLIYDDTLGTYGQVAVSAVNLAQWYHVMLIWKAATGAGNDDGEGHFYLGGVLVGSNTSIDNDGHDMDYCVIGMIWTNSTTFSGSFYLDEQYLDPVGAPFASTIAAGLGSYGLAIPIMDTTARYVSHTGPTAETHVVVDFWLDPNSLTFGEGELFTIARVSGGGLETYMNIDLYWTAAGGYQLANMFVQNDSAGTHGLASQSITDAGHHIRIIHTLASSAGTNDGATYLYIDGFLATSVTGIDNDTLTVGTISYGAVAGLDAGTSGIFYMDEMKWSNGPGAPPWIIPAAAQAGTYGMAITPYADTTAHYAEFTGPTADTITTVKFELDINTLTMATNDEFIVAQAVGEFYVSIKYTGSAYQIIATANLDSGTTSTTASAITDATHTVVVVWQASSSAGADDGYLSLYVDDVLIETLAVLNNDTLSYDEVRFGVVSGLDTGTSGTFYMDDLNWTNNGNFYPALTGSMTNTGAVTKFMTLAKTIMTGSMTNTGALVRQTNKVLAGVMTNTGAVIKQTAKTFAGTLTMSGGITTMMRKIIVFLFDVQLDSDGHLIVGPVNEDD